MYFHTEPEKRKHATTAQGITKDNSKMHETVHSIQQSSSTKVKLEAHPQWNNREEEENRYSRTTTPKEEVAAQKHTTGECTERIIVTVIT